MKFLVSTPFIRSDRKNLDSDSIKYHCHNNSPHLTAVNEVFESLAVELPNWFIITIHFVLLEYIDHHTIDLTCRF